MTNRPWSRRALLRGSGAALALPWLEAFVPRRAPAVPPSRLAILVMPNGVLPAAWAPAATADGGWSPSFALEPLAHRTADVTVCTGLANRGSFGGDGHYAKVAPLLTGAAIRRTGGRDLWNGVSVDQVAAQALGTATPLPSLELGCDPIYPVEDMGYSTVYGGHIAWAAPDRPLAKDLVPRHVFDRLFRRGAAAADPTRRSVLDVVAGDTAHLRRRLGRRDQDKLAEYLDAVRAVERRLDAVAALPRAEVPAAHAPPPGLPGDHGEHVDLLTELIALAFATDSTRIATFLLANEVSGRDFGFVDGCRGSFHEASHHDNQPEKLETYRRINRWYVARYARLLDRLAALREGAGTLLDHTTVVLAAAMRDGNAHDPHDLPLLLAGRGGGTPTGRLLASPKDTPLCAVWLALLRGLGVPAERFGDADRPLW
jgi:hypothetical protein